MKRFFAATTLGGAVLAVLLSVSHGVAAAVVRPAQAVTTHYTTSFAPEFGVGEWDGTLSLITQPDGTISGTYRPDYGGFVPVMGGRDGSRVWLDFEIAGRISVNGAVDSSGEIHARTYGIHPLDFTAKPAP
jgi:hypothetical protein